GAGGRAYIGSNNYSGGPGGGGGGGRVYLRTDTRTIEPQVGAAGIVGDGTGTHGATAGAPGVTCDDCLAP
ncbi:MAG: hypothetical protein K8M05_28720, partial [Deltaproteobacteria bacterium]|nr:hypothetical protein [Kofleriaceae bacterium]